MHNRITRLNLFGGGKIEIEDHSIEFPLFALKTGDLGTRANIRGKPRSKAPNLRAKQLGYQRILHPAPDQPANRFTEDVDDRPVLAARDRLDCYEHSLVLCDALASFGLGELVGYKKVDST